MSSTSASIATHAKERARAPSPRHLIWLEVAAFFVCIGYLFFLLREVLFLGRATLAHDNLFWTLPVFTFFAEGIGNGVLPLWNPYSHGGEPLAHVYLTTRLLDPISVSVAWLGQFVTSDLVLLANWDRILKALFTAVGAYLLLRPLTVSMLVRIALVPMLVLSNFTANALWQPGILDQFSYVPFFLIFLLNLLWKRDYRLHNWVGAATFFGASLQSYFFVGPMLIATLLLMGFVLFRRDDVWALLKERRNGARAFLALLMLVAMAGPQLHLYRDLDHFDFPLREGIAATGTSTKVTAPAKVGMSYETIYQTGSFSQLQDFLGLLVPGLLFLHRTSEAGLYLGGLVFLGALYGLVFASHPLKRIWSLIGGSVGLLMLGPLGGLHWLLYYVFPPLWFLRHTGQLVGLFQLAILFFFVIGAERWLAYWREGSVAPVAPSPPGPLTRLFGNAEHARAAVIVLVMGLILIAGPYLIRWKSERPMPFGLTSSVFLAVGLTIYLLRHDLGRRILVATTVTGMLGLAALLTYRTEAMLPLASGASIKIMDVFFHALLYAGLFTLAPLILISNGNNISTNDIAAQNDSAGDFDDRAVSGIRLVGSVSFLFIAIGFFYLPFSPAMSIDRVAVHVALAVLASASALGVLHPRWLIGITPALHAHLTTLRYMAALILCLLLIPLVYPGREGYFDTYAVIYFYPVKHDFLTRTFFYFHWLSLIAACAVIAIRPRLVPDALSNIRNTADAVRFATDALLICGLLPAVLVMYKFFALDNYLLQQDEILVGGSYALAAIGRGWIWLQTLLQKRSPNARQPGNIIRVIRIPVHFAPRVLVLWIALDLAISFAGPAPNILGFFVYTHTWPVPRPDDIYVRHGRPGKPVFPSHRVVISPLSPQIGTYVERTGQKMRYADLFSRTAAMLDLPEGMDKQAHKLAAAPLDELLDSDRNSGFIQFRGYSELLRAGLHPDLLTEIFSLNRPLIRFRPCAESKEAFLRQARSLMPDDAMSLLRRAVLLEQTPQTGSSCQALGTNEDRFTYRVMKYDYDTIRLKVNAPADGYLYYADGYDPYWTASVDGKPTTVLRANFNFKAVSVSTGEHEVEFAYSPTRLQWLIVIYFATFLAGIAVITVSLTHGSRRVH